MIIKPYEEWVEDRIEAAKEMGEEIEKDVDDQAEGVLCSDCGGYGVTDCDCICPNCEAEVDCPECDGSGYIDPDDYEKIENSVRKRATRQDYLRELSSDLIALSEWIGKPKIHHLIEMGFCPHRKDRSDPRTYITHHDSHLGAVTISIEA